MDIFRFGPQPLAHIRHLLQSTLILSPVSCLSKRSPFVCSLASSVRVVVILIFDVVGGFVYVWHSTGLMLRAKWLYCRYVHVMANISACICSAPARQAQFYSMRCDAKTGINFNMSICYASHVASINFAPATFHIFRSIYLDEWRHCSHCCRRTHWKIYDKRENENKNNRQKLRADKSVERQKSQTWANFKCKGVGRLVRYDLPAIISDSRALHDGFGHRPSRPSSSTRPQLHGGPPSRCNSKRRNIETKNGQKEE